MNWITILSVFFVTFTDKNGSQPIEFSERALFQRDQWNISIDSLDYAVSPTYIDSLRSIGAFVYHTSRWMNGATVSMTDAQAEIIGKWSFVQSIELTRDSTIASPVLQRKLESRSASNAQSSTTSQLAQFNLLPLHNAGYEGQGILMAICDAGFTNANTLTCFDHNKCLGTFDFSDENIFRIRANNNNENENRYFIFFIILLNTNKKRNIIYSYSI